MSGLRQGAVDRAEGVADLGTEQPHDSNHDDGDESEDDRVLDEALAFFLWCKQHGNIPFYKLVSSEVHPTELHKSITGFENISTPQKVSIRLQDF